MELNTTAKMKTAYIAHPISGDVKGNIDKVLNIVRELNLSDIELLPFAPYIVELQCLNDDVVSERAKGILNNLHIFKSGIIDELWLYGDKVSKGMYTEIMSAYNLGIKIVAKTEETKAKLQEYYDSLDYRETEEDYWQERRKREVMVSECSSCGAIYWYDCHC